MTNVGWQKLQVPLMERLALADMAERKGKRDEELLADIIREAVRRELVCKDANGAPAKAVAE